jgi:plastocyanin
MRAIRARSTRKAVVSCLCGIALLALTSCGSSTSSASSASATSSAGGSPAAGAGAATAGDAVITIHDFAFTTPASVSPGAKVSVHNTDGLAHTVTADEGKTFDSPAPAGDSSFTAPTTPGSYPFHCNIHPEMHGTLVVR